jgi:N-acetylmuramoyl-L-alanine amidase
VQFHVDTGIASSSGPICLYAGGDYVRAICDRALDEIEQRAGFRRRGVRYGGCFDMTQDAWRETFGDKAFLRRGALRSIIVECGVVDNARDRQWLQTTGPVVIAEAFAAALRGWSV